MIKNIDDIYKKENRDTENIFLIINNNVKLLEFKVNGDIYVKDKLIENDKEVIDAFREFLKNQNYLK